MALQVKELVTGLSEIPVVDKEDNVAGFLEFRNMPKSLEPRYGEFVESAGEGVFSPDTMRAELEGRGLWEDSVEGLCKKAGETAVKSIMTVPEEGRIIHAEGSINDAIFQMIASRQDHLFVRDGRVLAGVISLSAIMGHICDSVRACRIQSSLL